VTGNHLAVTASASKPPAPAPPFADSQVITWLFVDNHMKFAMLPASFTTFR